MPHYIKTGIWQQKDRGRFGELELENLIKAIPIADFDSFNITNPTNGQVLSYLDGVWINTEPGDNGQSYTFTNGITESPVGTVILGGALSDNTQIFSDAFEFIVEGYLISFQDTLNLPNNANTYLIVGSNLASMYLEDNTVAGNGAAVQVEKQAGTNNYGVYLYASNPSSTTDIELKGETGELLIRSTYVGFQGAKYSGDYSTSFTARSIPDKGYVDLAVSDIRLKENIVPIPNTLDKVDQLRAVEFDMIATKEHKSGFIAQEVMDIFPNLVETGDIYKIKRDEWIPILVKAIQELSSKVKELEAKIN